MKLRQDAIVGQTTARKLVEAKVINSLPILPEEREEARVWISTKKIIGEIMNELLLGRAKPIKRKGLVPNREGLKLLRKEFPRTYPKKANTDNKKMAWLKEQHDKGQIRLEILLDLVSVLRIKKPQKEKKDGELVF